MADVYFVRPLSPEQILQSYPLVSIFEPTLTKEQWVFYATSLVGETDLAKDSNIMTVQNKRGYIYGLSAYRVRSDLYHGQVLDAESFTVADFVGARSTTTHLVKTLESLARQRSCSCLSISLLNPSMRKWFRDRRNPASDVFRTSGYRFEPLRLRKCFQPGQVSGQA